MVTIAKARIAVEHRSFNCIRQMASHLIHLMVHWAFYHRVSSITPLVSCVASRLECVVQQQGGHVDHLTR